MSALDNLIGLSKLSWRVAYLADQGKVVRVDFHLIGTDEVVYKSCEPSLARKLMEAIE